MEACEFEGHRTGHVIFRAYSGNHNIMATDVFDKYSHAMQLIQYTETISSCIVSGKFNTSPTKSMWFMADLRTQD